MYSYRRLVWVDFYRRLRADLHAVVLVAEQLRADLHAVVLVAEQLRVDYGPPLPSDGLICERVKS